MWSPRRRDGAGSWQTDFPTELWLRASRGREAEHPGGMRARPTAGADLREYAHLRGAVSAAGEPGVSCGGAGTLLAGGDVAGGGVGGDEVRWSAAWRVRRTTSQIQSAQAQEREHHTNHDDESDQIDNAVHVSAPQRCQSCRNTNTQGREKVRRCPTPISPEMGERKRPILLRGVLSLRPPQLDDFAFTRKGR